MIKEKLNRIEGLYEKYKSALENNLDLAMNITRIYGENVKDARYFSMLATIYYMKGSVDKGISTIKEGLGTNPFNVDLHMNIAFLYEMAQNYTSALEHYMISSEYSGNKNDNEINENIYRLLREVSIILNENELYNKLQFKVKKADGRNYPLDENGESLIRKASENNPFLVNLTSQFTNVNIDNASRLFFKTELVSGEKITSEFKYTNNKPCIIPISLIELNTEITVIQNSNTYEFNSQTLSINKYEYLKFSQTGTIIIKTNNPIFVGKPITDSFKNEKPKLVMKLFIDGLSYKFIESKGFKELMPNAYQFFSKGFISKNCFINSEWTLPSKASINTGNYASRHKLLHPELVYNFEKSNKLLAEYFSEEGYYTARFDSNWRTTPRFGYYKGVDKIIYQNYLGGMDCKAVIMEAIEHISSFKNTNNFIALSFMDLHDVADEFDQHLHSSLNTDISMKKSKINKGVTSVLTNYDPVKVYKYENEIKRLDVFLGILLDYIQKNYHEDEYIVILHSDHGQTFLSPENSLYQEERIKIPFMMRGKGVPNIESDELIESVDILPAILTLTGFNTPQNIDGKLPKCLGGNTAKKHTFMQIIHPNQPYRAIITDQHHTFILESINNVSRDLSIFLNDFTISLVNKITKNEEKQYFEEKIEEYENLIFDNISTFLKWN
ncbi:sulfatase-like hydrolase/transferase [Viridibacillus arvi]|uniref:sulfatase-like hydrolase/transferase n=1 Tax=Viridibacillus arvi TaxID=263475 RepID=UPI0006A9593A|nr:sulfatase-like hydrolase/transferase [Viridibacillus arvi]